MLLFQSSSWKSGKKQKEQKQVSDVFKTECEASKQDSPQGFWKEKARAKIECSELRFDVKKLTRMWKHKPAKKKKRVLMFTKLGAEKISSTECQRI